jgi:hypothetical protein
MLPKEIFLSHSSADHVFTLSLADVLRRHGLPAWYSGTDIVGAQMWHDEIGSAIDRCDWFVAIISPRSIESMWVKRELAYALQQNRLENRIIPLIYQPCEYSRLSWTLAAYQIVDFSQNFEEGCHQLLRIWGIGFRPA